MNNRKNQSTYTLNNIVEEINILSSEKSKLEIDNIYIYTMIKELEENIVNSKVTLIEKAIVYFTLGFVNYKNKYKAIIVGYRKSIKELNSNITNAELRVIDAEIIKLKKKFQNHLSTFKKELIEFQTKLLFLSDNRYINNYKNKELQNELKEIVLNKEEFCLHENLKNDIRELLKFKENPKVWIEEKNILFVQNEKIKEKTFFDNIESNPLTNKQQDAVLINENNNLILAGAGSGKTSVIVAKVVYLIQQKVLHPSEVLILAFNKNAQLELTERFEAKGIEVQIKTFHSFGLSIIAESLSPNP